MTAAFMTQALTQDVSLVYRQGKKALLNAGADVNAKGAPGSTPLIWAASYGALFPNAQTTTFTGTICVTAQSGQIAVIALELDPANNVFTTLPVSAVN